jgi:hypothetical protein
MAGAHFVQPSINPFSVEMVDKMNVCQAIMGARGLRKLPEDEQRILIEEAQEYRTFASRGRAKHLLDRDDADPMTIYDDQPVTA